MTGNQIKGKGFRGALRYNLEKVEKGVAEILDYTFASTAEKIIMKEVQMVKVLRPNLQKYFYHTSINFPPGENLSSEKMKQIGLDYLESNGFTQHQFIMFRHYDADHPHLHILVNRIGYDGKVLRDSNDYQRSETILRDLEVKYNLTRVTPSRQASDRAITKNEFEMIKRTNDLSHKLKLQIILRNFLKEKQAMTTKEFIQALTSKGVNVVFNQASTGYVSGISYGYAGFIIKGAKLGNDFKWSSVKNVINYEHERDRVLIRESNNKVKGVYTDIKLNSMGMIIPTKSTLNCQSHESKNVRGFELMLTPILNKNTFYVDEQPEINTDSNPRKKRRKRRSRRQ